MRMDWEVGVMLVMLTRDVECRRCNRVRVMLVLSVGDAVMLSVECRRCNQLQACYHTPHTRVTRQASCDMTCRTSMSADWIDCVKLGGSFGGVMPVVFPAPAV